MESIWVALTVYGITMVVSLLVAFVIKGLSALIPSDD
jgi:Na+-transporting methylmalonyl-CoA/oxaloacetate decarboxylase gamma subunit